MTLRIISRCIRSSGYGGGWVTPRLLNASHMIWVVVVGHTSRHHRGFMIRPISLLSPRFNLLIPMFRLLSS
jgi:hypothetical protein